MTIDHAMMSLFMVGVWETVYMVFLSTLIGYVVGLPLGVLLVVTRQGGIHPMPVLNSIIGFIINLLRSIPFIILLVLIQPLTRQVVGTSIGAEAVIPPLIFAAAPYIARMVEGELLEVDAGVIEAAKSMGASDWQIMSKVLLPEAKPSIILGIALVLTNVVGYSCMSGFVGGGGIGDIAVRYGYYRYEFLMMILAVILLIVLVQLIQVIGTKLSIKTDKRIR